VSTPETATPISRTMATITAAAGTMYPNDAFPDDARVGERIAEAARADSGAARPIQQGVSTLNGGRPYDEVDATRMFRVTRYPAIHDVGTTRMSARPEDGVLKEFGRAHDVPKLFVSDAGVMAIGAAANPTLTIVALALRQANRIEDQLRAGTL
jgi:choline dehydrogenase-like flavoprotein